MNTIQTLRYTHFMKVNFTKYSILMDVFLICLLLSLLNSCKKVPRSLSNFQLGQIVQIEDLEDANNELIKNSLKNKLTFSTDIYVRKGISSPPWRRNLEEIVFSRKDIYNGVLIFTVEYKNGTMFEYWFARKAYNDAVNFIYLGKVDFTSYYKLRDFVDEEFVGNN